MQERPVEASSRAVKQTLQLELRMVAGWLQAAADAGNLAEMADALVKLEDWLVGDEDASD